MCSRSIEGANHHSRQRVQHKIAPKHHTSPKPQRFVYAEQSDQSNWHSSPGAVSIGTLTTDAALNLGPRRSRRWRTTRGEFP